MLSPDWWGGGVITWNQDVTFTVCSDLRDVSGGGDVPPAAISHHCLVKWRRIRLFEPKLRLFPPNDDECESCSAEMNNSMKERRSNYLFSSIFRSSFFFLFISDVMSSKDPINPQGRPPSPVSGPLISARDEGVGVSGSYPWRRPRGPCQPPSPERRP